MIHQKLLNVKSKIGTIGKDAFNKFGNYKYVTLDKIFDRLEPLLIAEGVVVNMRDWNFLQGIELNRKNKENVYTVSLVMYQVTIDVIDISDNSIQTFVFDVPMDSAQENFVQAFGSMTTYLRKYALAIIFDISFGDEDDPDRLTGADTVPVVKSAPAKPFSQIKEKVAYADKKLQRRIYNEQIKAKISDAKLLIIFNNNGATDWNDIPIDKVDAIIDEIQLNKVQ